MGAKKPQKADAAKAVQAQIDAIIDAFKEYDLSQQSTRVAHYRAIQRLYEGVVFMLNAADADEMARRFNEKYIKADVKKGNRYLPYVKLVFGEVVDTGKTEKVTITEKSGHKRVETRHIFKNEMDKGFNRYAHYLRWLFDQRVPIHEAAARLEAETLANVETADRNKYSDPNAETNRAHQQAKKLDEFRQKGAWGSVQIQLNSNPNGKLRKGLVDVVLDVQADGTALLAWVNPDPSKKSLTARVAARTKPEDQPSYYEGATVVELNDHRPNLTADFDEQRKAAQEVSALSSFPSQEVLREG